MGFIEIIICTLENQLFYFYDDKLAKVQWIEFWCKSEGILVPYAPLSGFLVIVLMSLIQSLTRA